MKNERSAFYMKYNYPVSVYTKNQDNRQVKQNISREIARNVSSALTGMSFDLPKKIMKELGR